jgi:hypothetical protein
MSLFKDGRTVQQHDSRLGCANAQVQFPDRWLIISVGVRSITELMDDFQESREEEFIVLSFLASSDWCFST